MTERWRSEAKKVVLEVHEAMRWHDDVGAVDAILELIERVQQETLREVDRQGWRLKEFNNHQTWADGVIAELSGSGAEYSPK